MAWKAPRSLIMPTRARVLSPLPSPRPIATTFPSEARPILHPFCLWYILAIFRRRGFAPHLA